MRKVLAVLSTLLATAGAATAQIGDLATLKADRAQTDELADSLQSVRVRYIVRKDSLSSRVDSLRSEDPESTDLRRVQLESRALLTRLLDVEIRLDSLAASADSLDEDLRSAYDWEMLQLLGLLEAAWDDGLYGQLEMFRQERAELGDAIGPGHYRFDDQHELALAEDDGPEEIEQKIELAQYKVARLQQERKDVSRRLDTLERLLVTRQLWYRDDGRDPLTRREVSAQLQPLLRDQETQLELLGPERRARTTPRPDTVAPAPIEAPLLLEVQRLKARQQELREIEAILQDRIGAFHKRMSRIVGESEE